MTRLSHGCGWRLHPVHSQSCSSCLNFRWWWFSCPGTEGWVHHQPEQRRGPGWGVVGPWTVCPPWCYWPVALQCVRWSWPMFPPTGWRLRYPHRPGDWIGRGWPPPETCPVELGWAACSGWDPRSSRSLDWALWTAGVRCASRSCCCRRCHHWGWTWCWRPCCPPSAVVAADSLSPAISTTGREFRRFRVLATKEKVCGEMRDASSWTTMSKWLRAKLMSAACSRSNGIWKATWMLLACRSGPKVAL